MKLKSLPALLLLILCYSCSTVKQQSQLKADFIGFSDDVTVSYLDDATLRSKSKYKESTRKKYQEEPIDLLKSKNINLFNNEIYSLRQGTNTCALYAYDIALDRIQYVQKNHMLKDPNSKYYIVMLTDGLDNNSPALGYERGKTNNPNDDNDYIEKIEKRKKNILKRYLLGNFIKAKNKTNEFYSYVLMYKGEDIRRSDYTDSELDESLSPYIGVQNTSSVSKPIMAESINELLERFDNEVISRSFTFNIQKSKTNETIKMFLDKDETIYFQCSLVRDKSLFKNKYKLENIEYSNGLTFELDADYQESSTSLDFTLKNIKLRNKPLKVISGDVSQYITDRGKLRFNSEYTSLSENFKNAYVNKILDGSNSFKDKYKEAQDEALIIVEILTKL